MNIEHELAQRLQSDFERHWNSKHLTNSEIKAKIKARLADEKGKRMAKPKGNIPSWEQLQTTKLFNNVH